MTISATNITAAAPPPASSTIAPLPTGNDFAIFLKVADFDTVYRRTKGQIKKNTPLSTTELDLLRSIYGEAKVIQFLASFNATITQSPITNHQSPITNDDRLDREKQRHANERTRLEQEIAQLRQQLEAKDNAHAAERKRIQDANATQINHLNDKIAGLQKLEAATQTAANDRADSAATRVRAEMTAEVERLKADNTRLSNTIAEKDTAAAERVKSATATIRAEMIGELEAVKAENKRLKLQASFQDGAWDDREKQIREAAKAQAEAEFLKNTEGSVEARVKQRVAAVSREHENARNNLRRELETQNTTLGVENAKLQDRERELLGRIAALESRINRDWKIRFVPTRLELPPLASLLLAGAGLWGLMEWFGIGIWIMILAVYFEAMDLLKNPKYQQTGFYMLLAVGIFEVLFLFLHPTTIATLVEGKANLLGDKMDYGWGFAFLISGLAVGCMWLIRKKTQDISAA